MQAASDAVSSGMVSILKMELEQVEQICEQARGEGEVLKVANLLCPGNIVDFGAHGGLRTSRRIGTGCRGFEDTAVGRGRGISHAMMDSAVDRIDGGFGRCAAASSRGFRWCQMWMLNHMTIRRKFVTC